MEVYYLSKFCNKLVEYGYNIRAVNRIVVGLVNPGMPETLVSYTYTKSRV